MNQFLYLPLLLSICPASALAQDTNVSVAAEIVDFLAQTEICLNLCRDEQSIQDMLPRLRELSAQAAALKQRQQQLPDITPAEDKEIAKKLISDYLKLQHAIEEHLSRLALRQLLTPELAEILCVPPNYTPQHTPTTN